MGLAGARWGWVELDGVGGVRRGFMELYAALCGALWGWMDLDRAGWS